MGPHISPSGSVTFESTLELFRIPGKVFHVPASLKVVLPPLWGALVVLSESHPVAL